MHKLIICCLCLFISFSATAQNWEIARAAELAEQKQLLKNQPLLIRLVEEDPAELRARRAEPQQLAAYRTYIAELNKMLARVAAKYWTLSPSVESKSEAELKELLKRNTGALAMLEYGPVKLYQSLGIGRDKIYTYTTEMGLTLKIAGKRRENFVLEEPVMTAFLYESDILFCLKKMERRFENPQLPDTHTVPDRYQMVLLLCQDARPPELTDEQIRRVYPHPYKFVTRAAFEAAVSSGEPAYGYVRFVPFYGRRYIPMVFTLPKGNIITQGHGTDAKRNLYVYEKDFIAFAKYMSF
jgi:hypothetical protein